MAKLKWAEFYARAFAWVGAVCFVIATALQLMKNPTSLFFNVSLGIVVVATLITGYLDLMRFVKKNLLIPQK